MASFIRMKPLACLAVAAACWLAAPAAHPAQSDDAAAVFKTVNGTVTVHRGATALPATPGMALQVADRLVSAAASGAGIAFRDGTLLTLGANADLLVRDYVFEPKEAKYAFSLYLAKGSALYASGKLGKVAPEAVRVQTPTATVAVRGTRFIVEADE